MSKFQGGVDNMSIFDFDSTKLSKKAKLVSNVREYAKVEHELIHNQGTLIYALAFFFIDIGINIFLLVKRTTLLK